MSVKLIIVALLAAAATTVRAADEDTKADTLVIKTCPADTVGCACAASADNTKNYTVGKCTADEEHKHWMLDACDAMVVKAYHNDACDLETLELKTACEAISYHKAECSGSTVKLFAGCNSNECETGKGVNGDGDNGCKNPTTFTIGGSTPSKCLKAGNKYYKPTSTECPADNGPVTFTQHLVKDCTDTGVSVAVPTACTATGYQKVTCSDKNGVSIDVCKKTDCEDCTSTKIPLKEYKKADSGDYLYIDSCPAATADNVTFQVYADVMKYELGCQGLVEATCGTTTTTTEATTSATETDPTNSTNETTNDTTTTGIIAPAHSAGVLALVLYLLACLY